MNVPSKEEKVKITGNTSKDMHKIKDYIHESFRNNQKTKSVQT